MRIGIDLDDVIVDFIKGLADYCNLKHHKKLSFEEWNTYFMSEAFGISKEEELRIVAEFHNSDEFNNLDFIKGALEGVKILSSKNKVVIITSREPRFNKATKDFLRKNISQNLEIMHSLSPKKFPGNTKADICKRESINILIDDNITYSKECADKGILVFLLDKPWNRGFEHNNIIRVNNWKEILEGISKLEAVELEDG